MGGFIQPIQTPLRGLIRLFILLGLFFVAIPALAEYTGPDRTYTTWSWRRSRCNYVASIPGGSCSLTLYRPPNGCPATADGGYFNPADTACGSTWPGTCGDKLTCTISKTGDSIVSCSEGQEGCRSVSSSSSHPPATVSGSLNCSQPGSNGWCTGPAALVVNANEPLTDKVILAIEGSQNGETFACSGSSCSLPLDEGLNAFEYWALSSWGDTSLKGSTTGRLDTRSPGLDGSLDGTPGADGWFVSDVTLSASATDPEPGSGLAGLTYTLNGASPAPFPGTLTLTDGVHAITLTASDAAGNANTTGQVIQVDTQPPQISSLLDGEIVNGWYTQSAAFSAAASDPEPGSGLETLIYSLNGNAWADYTAPLVIGDGLHALRLAAYDRAGNLAEQAFDFRVDAAPPRIRLAEQWYIWDVSVLRVDDGGSGLARVGLRIADPEGRWPAVERRYSPQGGSWSEEVYWDRRFADGTLAPIGRYRVDVWTEDRAGNESNFQAWVLIPAPDDPTPPLAPAVVPADEGDDDDEDENGAVVVQSYPAAPLPGPASGGTTVPTTFSSPPSDPLESLGLSSENLLWGAAAMAAIGASWAVLIDEKRKRKEEEARAAAEAARKNLDAGARDQGYDSHAAMVEHQIQVAQDKAFYAALEAWLATHPETEPGGGGKGVFSELPPTRLPTGISPAAQSAYVYGGTAAQTWINANADKLRDQYQVELANERARKAAEEARQALAAKMTALLDQVDKTAELKAGTVKPEKQPVDEAALLQAMVEQADMSETEKAAAYQGKTLLPEPIPMPKNLPPEAQAAFIYGGEQAQLWLWSNHRNLSEQHLERLQQTRQEYEIWSEHGGEGDLSDYLRMKQEVRADMRAEGWDLDWGVFISGGWQGMVASNQICFYTDMTNIATDSGITHINQDDELRWTGKTKTTDDGRLYYEVVLEDGTVGWARSDYLVENYPAGEVLPARIPNVKVPDKYYLDPVTKTIIGHGQFISIKPDEHNRLVRGGIDDRKTALCGEFSVAYIDGLRIDIALNRIWQIDPSLLDNAMKNKPTTRAELESMLNILGHETQTFADPLKINGQTVVEPGYIRQQLDQGKQLIMGVRVNSAGTLAQGTTDHWVTVTDVFRDADGNWQVRLYDSIKNDLVICDYQTFEKASLMFDNSNSYVGTWVESP